MSFRITTKGVLRNYRTNLQMNTKKIKETMTRVQTGRAFNSYAEDPAAASMAFQLRRNFWDTGNQIDNSEYVISKFQTAWDALDEIVDGTTERRGLSGIDTALSALNDPMGGARKTLGREMLSTADSIVMLMNTQYSDTFVFAGADGLNVPFTWSDDGSTLLYRGVDVNLPKPPMLNDYGLNSDTDLDMEVPAENEFPVNSAGELITQPALEQFESVDAYDAALLSYNKEKAAQFSEAEELYERVQKYNTDKSDYITKNNVSESDFNKIAVRFDEGTYVDIGLGMKPDEKGNVIPSSAFNSALSGLDFLGYGVDSDGDPLNLIGLMKELGQLFNDCDADSGAYGRYDDSGNWVQDDSLKARADVLTNKLHDAINRVSEQHVALDARVNYLKTNKTQLEDKQQLLMEQIDDTEMMDPAEAIMEMNWAQYCYNAALRIGNSILSQSLMDYLS